MRFRVLRTFAALLPGNPVFYAEETHEHADDAAVSKWAAAGLVRPILAAPLKKNREKAIPRRTVETRSSG